MIDYIMLAPSPVPRQLVTKPLFACFPVWGGGDVNVPVNLLTSCMLRELRGLGGGGVNVPDNLFTSCIPVDPMLGLFADICGKPCFLTSVGII